MIHLLHRLQCRLRYDKEFCSALTAYEEVFRDILREMHDDRAGGRRLKINFYWHSDSVLFDAFATPAFVFGRAIGVRVGCWIDLQSLANGIFCSHDLFKGIGDATLEQQSFAEWAADDGTSTPAAPLCPVRREAACLAVEFALSLIVLHEIAHHALGHLQGAGYLSRLRSRRESLSYAQPISHEAAKWAHAFEVEADRFAFSYLVALLAHDSLPFSQQLINNPLLRASLFEIGVLAFALIMFFLGGFGRSIDFYDRLDHPHPIVRFVESAAWSRRTIQMIDAAQIIDATRDSAALSESIAFLRYSSEADHLIHLFKEGRDEIKCRCAAIDATLEGAPARLRYDFRTGRWAKS